MSLKIPFTHPVHKPWKTIFKKVQSIIELHFVNGDIKIGSRSISTTHLRVEIDSGWKLIPPGRSMEDKKLAFLIGPILSVSWYSGVRSDGPLLPGFGIKQWPGGKNWEAMTSQGKYSHLFYPRGPMLIDEDSHFIPTPNQSWHWIHQYFYRDFKVIGNFANNGRSI